MGFNLLSVAPHVLLLLFRNVKFRLHKKITRIRTSKVLDKAQSRAPLDTLPIGYGVTFNLLFLLIFFLTRYGLNIYITSFISTEEVKKVDQDGKKVHKKRR